MKRLTVVLFVLCLTPNALTAHDAETLCLMALSARDRMDLNRAEALARKGIEVLGEFGLPKALGLCWQVLGEVGYYRGENPGAEDALRKALSFFQQAQDPLGQGNVWLMLGEIARIRDENEEAEGLYSKALLFFEQAEDPVVRGTSG